MSYTSLLIDTCTVQRYSSGVADEYGNSARTWSDNLTSQACRLQSLAARRTSREITIGAEVVIAEYTLFVQDIDVTEQDRIVLGTTTYEVILVTRLQDGIDSHHRECLLKVVR